MYAMSENPLLLLGDNKKHFDVKQENTLTSNKRDKQESNHASARYRANGASVSGRCVEGRAR